MSSHFDLTEVRMFEDDVGLREITLTSEQVYCGGFLDVRRDAVRLPNACTSHREYIVHPGASTVVPILDDGRVVVVRQWRHPMGRVMLEFPAGKLDADEMPLHCAMRELKEETGYQASEWACAGVMHNAIAYSTEAIHVWFARGLSSGAVRLGEGEFLEVGSATVDELLDSARSGFLTDAKTLTALLWLQNWQMGCWSLEWQPAS